MTLKLQTLPVSTNQLYKRGRGNRLYMDQRGKSCKEAISWEARSQYRGPILEIPLAVKVALYWPDRRKHDIDNIKVLLDALTGIVWADDGLIVDLHTAKAFDKNNPRVIMEITEVETKPRHEQRTPSENPC